MFYKRLSKAGVRIYEYTGGILRAKVMILDDCWFQQHELSEFLL